MPVDFTTSDDTTPTDGETPMFAGTPLWDRDVKKRRGRARSAAPRIVSDPAIDAGEAGAGAGVMGATTATEPLDSVYETQPAEPEIRRTAPVRRSGVPAGAIAAGAVAVAALAGFGWYASQPHQRGVAELTPGAPATSQIALNTAAPPSADQLPAGAAATTQTTTSTHTASPPARETSISAPAATTSTTRRSTTTASRAPARVRPAESGSALDAGVNASTTAPMVAPPAPSAPATGPTVNTPAEVMAPSTAAPSPSLSAPSAGSTSTAPQATTPQSTTSSTTPSSDPTTTP